jgi:cell division protein FtsB
VTGEELAIVTLTMQAQTGAVEALSRAVQEMAAERGRLLRRVAELEAELGAILERAR